jgi:predicted TIM-barrel fold metal-dependent hydrolase
MQTQGRKCYRLFLNLGHHSIVGGIEEGGQTKVTGKVLYSTGQPRASMDSYPQFVHELTLPPKDRALMLFENAAKLFELDIPVSPAGVCALLRGM